MIRPDEQIPCPPSPSEPIAPVDGLTVSRRHNAGIYGVASRIRFVHDDFAHFAETYEGQARGAWVVEWEATKTMGEDA